MMSIRARINAQSIKKSVIPPNESNAQRAEISTKSNHPCYVKRLTSLTSHRFVSRIPSIPLYAQARMPNASRSSVLISHSHTKSWLWHVDDRCELFNVTCRSAFVFGQWLNYVFKLFSHKMFTQTLIWTYTYHRMSDGTCQYLLIRGTTSVGEWVFKIKKMRLLQLSCKQNEILINRFTKRLQRK